MTTLNVQLLTEKSDKLAKYITRLHFEHDPGLMQRYGAEGKKRCYEDAVFHLNFLVEAMTMKLPDIYVNYIHWAQAMLKSRNIPETDLRHNLDFAQQAIHEIMGSQFSSVTKKYIDVAIERLKKNTEADLSFITEDNPLREEVTAYLEFLLQGERRKATLLITKLMEQGTSIKDIYQHIFQVSQYEVGSLWERNKITVAHEHYYKYGYGWSQQTK